MTYAKSFVYYYDVFKDDKAYARTVAMLDRWFKKHKVKTLLDIGCGTGKVDKMLKDKGYSVIGIDNSKEMINHAKKNYSNIIFKLMEAQSFKFKQKFDAIIALDSVMTFLTKKGDLERALKNIVEHMKKGSIFYFNTGFTEEMIPRVFTDCYSVSVQKNNQSYEKEYSMIRKGDKLVTDIRIMENGKLVIRERHVHRIISERFVVELLKDLGCDVKIKGNSNVKVWKPMEVFAKRLR
jgi:predicted TPR repeat methyltransferase